MFALLITVPKAGTHIMWQLFGNPINIMESAHHAWEDDQPVQKVVNDLKTLGAPVNHAHLRYAKAYEDILKNRVETSNLKIFFTYRDPRDVLLSFVH